jgi:hypothetical protein
VTLVAGLTVAAEPGYVIGDFHQHTCYTDGSYSLGGLASNNVRFGLNWWAHSEHGGAFYRNGRLSGLDVGQTVYWDQTPGVTILGDVSISSSHTNMWRWQSVRDYQFADVLTARALYSGKPVFLGLEWSIPGHDHCSMAVMAGQFDAQPTANALAEFEYRFDYYDTDRTGGAAQGWNKSANTGHAKALEAAGWLQTNYPTSSWLVPAHPERKGWYDVAAFRDLNRMAPDVCFGFESMPGNKHTTNDRGGYGDDSVGGGTYGGCGIYAAQVGGLWDALLGEGRR